MVVGLHNRIRKEWPCSSLSLYTNSHTVARLDPEISFYVSDMLMILNSFWPAQNSDLNYSKHLWDEFKCGQPPREVEAVTAANREKKHIIKTGVPQDSVLHPFLFSFYSLFLVRGHLLMYFHTPALLITLISSLPSSDTYVLHGFLHVWPTSHYAW